MKTPANQAQKTRNGIQRDVEVPKGGWKEHTFYVVDVSFSIDNIIHRDLFFTGFLDHEKKPAGYNKFFNAEYTISYAVYLRVVEEVLDWNKHRAVFGSTARMMNDGKKN